MRIAIPIVAAFAVSMLGGCASIGPEWEEPGYKRLASPIVQEFRDRDELQAFAKRTAETRKARRERIRRAYPGTGNRIVITGSRIITPPSITNNQVSGVDEGDFVKRVGDYLLILQDGRIFAIDFREMRLADWKEVYRRDDEGEALGADWYDELLVWGQTIVATAYDYEREATELTLFALDGASGELTRGETFLLPSYDYYSTTNYATRIIDGELILYLPMPLDSLLDDRDPPVIRRLGSDRADMRAVVEPQAIYRPVFATPDPVVHVMLACDLAAMGRGEIDCTSRGLVGSGIAEWYIDETATWFLVAQDRRPDIFYEECPSAGRASAAEIPESVVWRLPHDGSDATILPVRGMPPDQFGMSVAEQRFRLFTMWEREDCWREWEDPFRVALFDVPLNDFSRRYAPATDDDAKPLPDIRGADLQNRFASGWLVYGARENPEGGPLAATDQPVTDELVVAVPLGRPSNARKIPVGHQLRRLETLGDDIVLTGYRTTDGLRVTRLSLEGDVRISGRTFVEDRFESESRSHSFNYRLDGKDTGMMAVPTVGAGDNDDARPWRSEPSDITFLTFGADGGVVPAFTLEGALEFGQVESDEDGGGDWMHYANGYECEVSCTDWYGNARPIFIEGSVFALMGPALVKADVTGGSIRETGRLDITEAVMSGQ